MRTIIVTLQQNDAIMIVLRNGNGYVYRLFIMVFHVIRFTAAYRISYILFVSLLETTAINTESRITNPT